MTKDSKTAFRWSSALWKTPAVMMKSPYLDNIETSCPTSQISKPLHIKDSATSEEEKLYIFDLEKYKLLSIKTSTSIEDFSDIDDLRSKANNIRLCGSDVGIVGNKIVSANFCRHRLCPMCQRRKSLKVYSDFCRIYEDLKDYAFLHLVLTVSNCNGCDLSETIDLMQKCSSRFFNHSDIKRVFVGVARCLEVTYNSKTITFHPHYHCLVAVKKSYFTSRYYLKRERLVNIWSAIWCMRWGNVRKIKDSMIDSYNLVNGSHLQLYVAKADSGALPEIAKYAVKPLDLNLTNKERASVLDVLYMGLKNRRLIQTYGVIKDSAKKLKINLDDDSDDLTVDKDKLSLYTYNYRLLHYEKGDLI